MSPASFEWVERIHSSLQELDQKPQFGSPFPFPWKVFNSTLREIFGKKDLTVDPGEMRWLPKEKLLQGIGENPQILGILFSPLEPMIYWVISEQDLKGLLAAFLEVDNEKTILLEQEIYKGFSHFMAIEALNIISQLNFSQDLSPRIASLEKNWTKENLPDCFRIDLSIKLKERTFWGFVLIPNDFRNEWKRHFLINAQDHLDPITAQKISLEVALEIGKSDLVYQEWKEAKEGDFIILDQCSFDPATKSGRLILTVNGRSIFRAKIKEEGLKLLEYPLYEEMLGGKMGKAFDDDDDDLFDDLDDLDEDTEEEDEEIEEIEDEEAEVLTGNEEPSAPKEEDKSYLSPENIPVQLTVEVGRIKMTALELMNLQPGNLIEMKVAPEQGVDLILNGKRVGRGELIKMGEVLGVRILKL